MPPARLLAAAALALAAAAVAADPPKAEAKTRPTTKEEFAALAKENPMPRWLPYKNNPKRVAVKHVHGTVVDVGEEFIEIVPKGQQKAVTYPAHVLLATGAVCHWLTDSECYLLDDVRKGDEVVLGVGTVEKEVGEECFYLTIRKRPGGVIPASRKPREHKPYHLERQAEIDRGEVKIKKPDPPRQEEKQEPPGK